MENDFNLILNNGEEIRKTYKPNKLKFYFSSMFALIWVYISFIAYIFFGYFIPDENGESMPLFVLIICLSVVLVIFILHIVFTKMAFKKRIYCVTNQRLIIRCGVIGIDYKSLDLKFIGAVDVYVSILDKIIRKNTGTLRFGSMSSPMNNGSIFSFSSIYSPYEIYKEIKQIIEEKRNNI